VPAAGAAYRWFAGRMVGLLVTQDVSQDGSTKCCETVSILSYRRYIRPLLPTLATVKGLPSLPPAPPSGGTSYLGSSSLLALRLKLFSLRNPSGKGFFVRAAESNRWTIPLDLGPGASAILASGDPPISCDAAGAAAGAAAGRLELAKPRRGESRSRCRRRRLSGERAMMVVAEDAARGLGATTTSMMVVGIADYIVAIRDFLRCIEWRPVQGVVGDLWNARLID
jgi:hypothetical protein